MNERNRRERESTAHELNRMNEPEWTEEASDKELPTQPLPRATQMELLAPAGGPAPFTAALAGGADAIYCGLGNNFNARRGADNFDDESFARACRQAHLAGARVYVTVNVVVKWDEMQRVLRLIQHHFHAIGILEFSKIVQRMGGGCHRRVAVGKLFGNAVNQRGRNHRLIALHVHNNLVFRQPQQLHRFGKARAAALVGAAGKHAGDVVRSAGSLNIGVVSGNDDAAGVALLGALGNAHNHRLAVDVGKGFVGQAAGR